MTTDFDQPVYLVIGGADGIGSALARRLIGRGGTVVLAGREGSRTRARAAELTAHAESVDAVSFQQVQDLVARVMEQHGRLDGVANLAGSILVKPVSAVSESGFHETINQNLSSAFAVVRAAAKASIIGLTQSAAASLAASASARAASVAMHPLGRLGNPDDSARAVEWLLTDDASWVTGQTIGVDGGLAAIKGR